MLVCPLTPLQERSVDTHRSVIGTSVLCHLNSNFLKTSEIEYQDAGGPADHPPEPDTLYGLPIHPRLNFPEEKSFTGPLQTLRDLSRFTHLGVTLL